MATTQQPCISYDFTMCPTRVVSLHLTFSDFFILTKKKILNGYSNFHEFLIKSSQFLFKWPEMKMALCTILIFAFYNLKKYLLFLIKKKIYNSYRQKIKIMILLVLKSGKMILILSIIATITNCKNRVLKKSLDFLIDRKR